ncbi:MAG TPA: SIMPL domain-containing protein [Pyrinomonadaceae bacterium]|nr:SIMPL domain-containing protein [Pyrinomonadaceae bacterium]
MRKSWFAARVISVALALAFAGQAVARQQPQKGGEITVEGRLARTIEAGGWLIVADYGKYLILNSRQYQSEPWFREGATVQATGEARQDAVTIYQEGMPFQARTMRARGGRAASGNTQAGGNQSGGNQSGGNQTVGTSALAGRGVTRVVVSGDASVRAQPDTAILSLGVVTQNASASEAQAENASRTDAVVRAVRSAAGAGAEVKTSGYSVQPQYVYKEGVPPTITGYVVHDSILLTTGEMDRAGAIIDAASRAGANSVDGLSFTLRRDETARSQALTAATLEAISKARVVANALGGRVVRVVEVQEGGTARPVSVLMGGERRITATAQASVPTPVEAGPLEIRAEVTLIAEVETKE